jgi:hypothetical protein
MNICDYVGSAATLFRSLSSWRTINERFAFFSLSSLQRFSILESQNTKTKGCIHCAPKRRRQACGWCKKKIPSKLEIFLSFSHILPCEIPFTNYDFFMLATGGIESLLVFSIYGVAGHFSHHSGRSHLNAFSYFSHLTYQHYSWLKYELKFLSERVFCRGARSTATWARNSERFELKIRYGMVEESRMILKLRE